MGEIDALREILGYVRLFRGAAEKRASRQSTMDQTERWRANAVGGSLPPAGRPGETVGTLVTAVATLGIPAGWFEQSEDWRAAYSQTTGTTTLGALGREQEGHPSLILVVRHDDEREVGADPRDFMRTATDMRAEFLDRAQRHGLESIEGPTRVTLDGRPAVWLRYFTRQMRGREAVRIGNEEVKLIVGGRVLEVSLMTRDDHLPLFHPDFETVLGSTKWTV